MRVFTNIETFGEHLSPSCNCLVTLMKRLKGHKHRLRAWHSNSIHDAALDLYDIIQYISPGAALKSTSLPLSPGVPGPEGGQ